MCSRKTGVIASSNFNGNNGSTATIENSTSFTNNSHYNGTINELVVSETIPSDANAKHVVEASLSSLSLTRDNNSSGVVPSIDGASNRESVVNAPAAAAVTEAPTTTTSTTTTTATATTQTASATTNTVSPRTVATSTSTRVETIHTTITPLTGGPITNRMQTSQFIASSNTRRDSPSTLSTLPITTNKPREYIPTQI